MPPLSRRQFEIRDLLGQGGFGVVYRATLQSSGGLRQDAAVKFLRDPSPEALSRLEREGRMLSGLCHPAILNVVDLVRLDGMVALVTEYVAGMDLTEALRVDPGLPPRAVVEVIGVVAEALQAATSPATSDTIGATTTGPMLLVHRDVKPSNIRIGRFGGVKLLDFGVAWSAAQASTRGDSFVGSVPYMAPERLQRNRAQPAGDIYGLGCTLYEGLAGARLHAGDTFMEIVARVNTLAMAPSRHDEHVDNALSRLDVPAEIGDLLERMLAHDPARRPGAPEVAIQCDQLGASLSGERLKHWCQARSWTGETRTEGPLTGRTLLEEPIDQTIAPIDERQVAAPVAPTFDLDARHSRSTAESALSTPSRSRGWMRWAGGGAVFAALAGVAIFGTRQPIDAAGAGADDVKPPAQDVSTTDATATPSTPEAAPVDGNGDVPPPEKEPQPTAKTKRGSSGAAADNGEGRTTGGRPRSTVPPDEPQITVAEEVPPAPARVRFVGDYQDLKLLDGDKREQTGGSVPPGAYTVFIKPKGSDDWAPIHSISVAPGQELRLQCNQMKWECEELD